MRKKVPPHLPTFPTNIMHFSWCGADFVLYGAYMHLDGLLQRGEETDIKYVLLSIQYSTFEYT